MCAWAIQAKLDKFNLNLISKIYDQYINCVKILIHDEN